MKTNFSILTCAFGIAITSMMVSCSKNGDIEAPLLKPATLATSPASVGDSVVLDTINGTKGYLKTLATGVYGARNFHQGTVPDLVDTTQWSNPASTYYYSLSNNDGGNSGNWDFKFSGTANADFTVNTSKYTLSYTNTVFGSVTSGTSTTPISGGTAGYNSLTGIGNSSSSGWYIYSIATHIMSSYQPRTYVLTPVGSGTKWKIKLNSVYKNETPNSGYAATNYPFMSFDYSAL